MAEVVAPTPEARWVNLEVLAWQHSKTAPSFRGRTKLEQGARNRWQDLAAHHGVFAPALVSFDSAAERLRDAQAPPNVIDEAVPPALPDHRNDANARAARRWLRRQRRLPTRLQDYATSATNLHGLINAHAIAHAKQQSLLAYLADIVADCNTDAPIATAGIAPLAPYWPVERTRREVDETLPAKPIIPADRSLVDIGVLQIYMTVLDTHVNVYDAITTTLAPMIAAMAAQPAQNAEIREALQRVNSYCGRKLVACQTGLTDLTAIENEAMAAQGDFMDSLLAGNGAGNVAGTWRGPRLLGQGGHASAWIFVLEDANGDIVGRTVTKEAANFNPSQTRNTPESRTWQPPGNMPIEVAAMYKLRNLRNSDRIVRLNHWQANPHPRIHRGEEMQQFRLYLEYCGYGSVWDLRQQYYPYLPHDEPIPQAFLLALFESLAISGLLMQRGYMEIDRDDGQLWDQIVHCDMKSDNILLGEHHRTRFSGYSLPKLNDFGMAMIIPKADPAAGAGVETWTAWNAPETRTPYVVGERTHVPGTLSNVWGVGFVMRSLLVRDPHESLYIDGVPGNAVPVFDDIIVQAYMSQLLVLIRECLDPDPGRRPSFEQIREEVQDMIVNDADAVRLAIRPAGDPLWNQHRLVATADTYALGLSVDIVLGA